MRGINIFSVLFIPLGFVLVMRFITVDNFFPQPEKLTRKCSQENQPQFDEEGFEIISHAPLCGVLEKINSDYISHVKPILSKKCLSCHGIPKTLPLYSKIPPMSWLVAYDLREAKEHMNMTFDFPFQGHGGADEDLEAIAKVVKKNSMPPLRYKIMHWQSSLTEEEKMTILKWVQDGRNLLRAP